jgi:predicted nucleic acid-binding protein
MVKIPAVLDSTCLIGLERIGQMNVIPALLEPVCAPPVVETEFGSRPEWLQVEDPSDSSMVAALRLVVDEGEAGAIALAYEKGVRLIVDDRKAREAALRLGIPITGTVGLLLKAKEMGIILAIRPLLDALDEHQFHIGTALRAEALRLSGE